MRANPPSPLHLRSLPCMGLLIIFLGIILAAGCISVPAAPDTTYTPVGKIAETPAAFEGKDVAVKGKITGECGSGCWFLLDDGTGTIYVDLAENNFAIPQLQGSTVLVKGTVRMEYGDPRIFATSVTTDSRTYP